MRMAWVAPAVMVISAFASYLAAVKRFYFCSYGWRRPGMPAMGGYWLWPALHGAVTASVSAGSQAKSGKPWPRLTARCSAPGPT